MGDGISVGFLCGYGFGLFEVGDELVDVVGEGVVLSGVGVIVGEGWVDVMYFMRLE